MRNTVVHDAENLGLEPIYEAKSGNESPMDQVPNICKRVYEKSTYNMWRICVIIKKYSMKKPPYFQIQLFTAKENEVLMQVAYFN